MDTFDRVVLIARIGVIAGLLIYFFPMDGKVRIPAEAVPRATAGGAGFGGVVQ